MINIRIWGSANSINNSETKGMMTANMTVQEVLSAYEFDAQVNRELSKGRIPSLVKYIDGWKDTMGIYFPALVFSYRGDFRKNYDRDESALYLVNGEKLTCLDGQHRIHAMMKYYSGLQDDHVRDEFLSNKLTVQIYIGLTKDEEKTLFSDINSHAQRVPAALITQYDARDPINVLVRHLLNGSTALQNAGVEIKKNTLLRPVNTNFCHISKLGNIITFLLYNKKTITKAEEKYLECKLDKILSFLVDFFDVFFSVLPNKPGDINRHVFGHEAIQYAIMRYLSERIIAIEDTNLAWKREWVREVVKLEKVDWTVENLDWERWMIIKKALNGRVYREFPHPYISGLRDYINTKING